MLDLRPLPSFLNFSLLSLIVFFLQRFSIRFLETDSFSSFNVLRELITLFRSLTLSRSSSICGLDQRPSLELSNLFFELSRLSFFSICLSIFSATLEFASFSISSHCSKYPKTHCLSWWPVLQSVENTYERGL